MRKNGTKTYFIQDVSQVHKTVAAAVLEEIAKPLKVFGEIQHKARKATEALVRNLRNHF